MHPWVSITSEEWTAATRLTPAQLERRLRLVYDTAAHLCLEAGCHCLAQRFAVLTAACAGGQCGCGTPSLLHLLVKLAPLARLTAQAGHHDVALMLVELALPFEPTLDLQLTRALAQAALGDTDEAWRGYAAIIEWRGSVPPAAVAELSALAQAHPDEDDLAELADQLQRCAA